MMTVEAFYHSLGGDSRAVLARIPSEALIRKFAAAFEKDRSFGELCDAFAAGDRSTAFRAAHTLKGVCANLGFETLRQSASALTEILRAENAAIPPEAAAELCAVERDYRAVISAIEKLLSED